jgi:rod shape-determining protein MreD
MKTTLLIAATYLFMLLVMNIGPKAPDLLLILLFFVAYNEPLFFAIVYGFLLGLTIDLLNPAHLGIHALVYLLLPLGIQFLKVRLYQNALSVSLSFAIVFVLKVLIIGLTAGELNVFLSVYLLYTLIFFFPVFLFANRLMFGSWMRRV